MKILVVIANYGTGHEVYLSRLVEEYRSMPHDIDITVLSNIPKQVPPGVAVVVGLPNKNPWSLPHGHKAIFANFVDEYDLFIYSEDDHLISERNITAFLEVSKVLPDSELAGFLVSEHDPEGVLSFCAMHGPFRWDPSSVRKRGEYTFAYLTNEHSACYIVTRRQLKLAISSGGFLVEPHDGKYDVACTASTDIYTQCGFRKLICISHLTDFLVPHLPNKYVGQYGLGEKDLYRQISALLDIGEGIRPAETLLVPETRLKGTPWSKDYYESVREDILSLISSDVRNVLSVGCGLGNTEECLTERGIRVVALPADSVVSANAEARGVKVVNADFETALKALSGERFDCIFFAGVLHLLPDPAAILKSFGELLANAGVIIISVPNHNYLGVWRARMRRNGHLKDLGDYQSTGIQLTTGHRVRTWLKQSGLTLRKIQGLVPGRFHILQRCTFGFFSAVLQSDMVVVATPREPTYTRRVARSLWLI